MAHESHHFYYKSYRNEEYTKIKKNDNKRDLRKFKDLEVLADSFMVNFMGQKGDLELMIAGLVEKFNQMKQDNYTIDERIDDIVKKVEKDYAL